MLVCIDAGHGGKDVGAIYNGYVEKNITLETATTLKTILEKCGVNVVLTRSNDSYVSLQERCDKANSKMANLFISLHVNDYSDKKVNGTETFVYKNKSVEATRLATMVQKSMLRHFGTKDRGIKTSDFKVLRSTNMTAILCECGFIGSSDMNNINANLYAKSVAKGVCEYLGIEFIDTDYLYRVCIGSYKDINNANNSLKNAKSKGFKDSFIAKYKRGE